MVDTATVNACAGCGAHGFGPGFTQGTGIALHWKRKGKWVCIECSKSIPRDPEDVPEEVVDELLALERTIRNMRGAVAPFTRAVDDHMRKLDALRGDDTRTVPRIVIAEREAAVTYVRKRSQDLREANCVRSANEMLFVARELEVGTHIHGCKP
jgi:hypothetical protein